jgi:hypothetical protein
MEETDLETTPQVDTESESSKKPVVVGALALFGAGVLAKKAFDKARKLRIVSKDRLDALENQSTPQAK